MQFNFITKLTLAAAILAATPALANPVPEPRVGSSSIAVSLSESTANPDTIPYPFAPTAATAFQGSATFVVSYSLLGLTRYRFSYNGVDGVSFLHAIQNCGGITNDWQSWSENGHDFFDVGEVPGILGAKAISCGIYAVTGQDCHQINEIGC